MERYIWLLPTIFMFHDMEEIIGMRKWLSGHYDDVVARIPMARKLLEPLRDISTARFAAAVYEELIVFIIICLLADAMVAFHQRYPNIQLSIVEGSTARLQEHVLDGTVDFSLLYEPLDTGLFQWMPLMEESVLLAVPAEHPLAREYEGVQPEP